MNADRIFNIFGGVLTIALVTSVLIRGSEAAQVIRSVGDAFSGSIRAAIKP